MRNYLLLHRRRHHRADGRCCWGLLHMDRVEPLIYFKSWHEIIQNSSTILSRSLSSVQTAEAPDATHTYRRPAEDAKAPERLATAATTSGTRYTCTGLHEDVLSIIDNLFDRRGPARHHGRIDRMGGHNLDRGFDSLSSHQDRKSSSKDPDEFPVADSGSRANQPPQ